MPRLSIFVNPYSLLVNSSQITIPCVYTFSDVLSQFNQSPSTFKVEQLENNDEKLLQPLLIWVPIELMFEFEFVLVVVIFIVFLNRYFN